MLNQTLNRSRSIGLDLGLECVTLALPLTLEVQDPLCMDSNGREGLDLAANSVIIVSFMP